MNYPARNISKAFTAIEFIMVIVIVGILAALIIPRFDVFYGMKFRGGVKKLESDIIYVQNVAITQHTNTRIVFDTVNNIYTAKRCNASCTLEANWQYLKDTFSRQDLIVDYRADAQYGGIDIVSADFGGTSTLRFDWQGIPKNSSGNNLTSEGRVSLSYRDNDLTVSVIPQTGKLALE